VKWDYLFSHLILSRGSQYYRKGQVQNLVQNGSDYRAEVVGSVVYRVSVQLANERAPKLTCTCPYAQEGKRCKHMAAVLYAIDAGYATGKAAKIKAKKQIFLFKKNLTETQGKYRYFDLEQITTGFVFYDTVCEEAKSMIAAGSARLLKVDTMYANHIDGTELEGIVRGAVRYGKEDYLVTITFDRHQIKEVVCRIPGCNKSYDSYYYGRYSMEKSLCVHATALLFLLDDYLDKNNIGDSTDQRADSLLLNYRNRYIMQRSLAKEEVQGKSELILEPRLEKSYDNLYLSFRIGTGKLFVVKNLTALVEAIDQGAAMTFGSKSEINFTVCKFSEKSQQYYGFLKDIVITEQCRSRVATRAYRYYDNTGETIKGNMLIYGERLDKLFELAEGTSITFVDKDGLQTASSRLHFQQQDPKLCLTISKAVDRKGTFHGITVTGNVPELFNGLHYQYCLQGEALIRISEEKAKDIAPLLDIQSAGRISFSVGRRHLAEFYYQVLPVLRSCADIVEKDVTEVEQYLPPEVSFVFYLDAEKGNVTCQPKARYGEVECSLLDWQSAGLPVEDYRDSFREQETLGLLQSYFPAVDAAQGVLHCDGREDTIYRLLDSGVDTLLQLGEVKSTDRFLRLKIRKQPKVSVGVSVESDIMNLTVTSEDLTPQELLDILYSYKSRKKYFRLKNGDFLNIENDNFEELAAMLEVLHVSPKEFVKGKMQLPVYRALYLDKMLEKNESIYAERDRHFKALVKEFKTVSDSEFEVPESLKQVMRNYQIFGYKWLRTLGSYGFGGILADDMGLGKTLQMISVLLSAKEEGTAGISLIITPSSLVYNWQEELARFAPSLSVCAVTGTKNEREEKIRQYRDYDVLVTSYDLLKRDIAEYEDKEFLYQVIDEGQYIKNHETAAAKSVKVIKSRLRFALTGTPIENRLSELWSIFDYLMPGFLYGYDTFRREFENPITKNKEEEAIKSLKRMVAPFILRRLKKDVLKDLPDKLEEVRYAKMEDKQQKLYDGQVVHMLDMVKGQSDESFRKNKLQILSELTKIRQICCDPALLLEDYDGESAKREACMELIHSAIEGEHKMLVFSQFTSMLELLERDLKREKIPYYKITGATPKEERLKLVHSFNKDTTPVFLISLKAGGTGLNLVGADVVIHYDPWWNLAVQNQATDRAHRIGQTKAVAVYKLIVKNSIEEKIMHMQETKKNLADEILNGENGSIVGMSRQELLELLQM